MEGQGTSNIKQVILKLDKAVQFISYCLGQDDIDIYI